MKYQWRHITASALISDVPVVITTIILTPPANNSATISIYDGESTSDEKICRIKGYWPMTERVSFNPPLETHRGLYIDLTVNCDDCLVQYAVKGV